jgi:hypothetical protein
MKKGNQGNGKKEDRGRVKLTVQAMPRMVPQGYARAGKSHIGDDEGKEKVVGPTSIVTSRTRGTIHSMLLPLPVFMTMMRSLGFSQMAMRASICAGLSVIDGSFLRCLIARRILDLMSSVAGHREDGGL